MAGDLFGPPATRAGPRVGAACGALAAALAYAPGAAAKTDPLRRPPRQPVYSVSAEVHVPVLVGGGAAVASPPVGFGASLSFRYHGVALGPGRLGGLVAVGHDRVLDRTRRTVTDAMGQTRSVVRYAALDQTTFVVGPSLHLPARRVFLTAGGGVGLTVGNLVRPSLEDPSVELQTTGVGLALRADAELGIPLRGRHGLVVGFAFLKVFSKARTPEVPTTQEGTADVAPFDMTLIPYLGYKGWF